MPRKSTSAERVDQADAGAEPRNAPAVCLLPECGRFATRRGLCNAHYDTHRGLAVKETPDG